MMNEDVYIREFYPTGKIIFLEGAPGYEMYLVEDGDVLIWKQINSEKKVLATLGKGKIFGEMALIDASPRMATAEAGPRGASCVKVNAQKLNEGLEKSSPLIRSLIKALVENLRRAQQ